MNLPALEEPKPGEDRFDPQTDRPAAPPADGRDLPVSNSGVNRLEGLANRVRSLLDQGDDAQLRQLEQATDMSRIELQQFAERFSKPDNLGPAGPGGEIQAGQQPDEVLAPRAGIGERVQGNLRTERNQRGPGSAPQDTLREQTTGIRLQAPPEIRSRFEAYQNSISRSRTAPAPKGSTPPPPADANRR